MREIKFRAWNSRLKLMSEPFTMSDLLSAEVGLLHKSNYTDPIEWLLYTGLRDKQGKEICEGDILNSDSPGWYTFRIIWYKEKCRFLLEDIGASPAKRDLCEAELYSMKVIGNIYEHSCLLDKKTENGSSLL